MYIAEIAEKNDMLIKLYNRWIFLKTKGKEISTYLAKRNIRKIAVYGIGDLGIRLMEDLSGTEVEVMLGIDKNAAEIDAPVEIVLPNPDNIEKWKNTDAVVVTSVYYFNEIYYSIRKVGYNNCILALNDILMDM